MTGNDFTLDINNPEDPKILCVGNNPDRQNIYSAALGLYNSRIVRLINKKGKLKSSIIIDEPAHDLFPGLDNLIATARSNKVAVCLNFQDFSQARTRLRPGGSQGHREYRGQHLRRSGFGRYGQDVERALRQDRTCGPPTR